VNDRGGAARIVLLAASGVPSPQNASVG